MSALKDVGHPTQLMNHSGRSRDLPWTSQSSLASAGGTCKACSLRLTPWVIINTSNSDSTVLQFQLYQQATSSLLEGRYAYARGRGVVCSYETVFQVPVWFVGDIRMGLPRVRDGSIASLSVLRPGQA